MSRWNFLSEDSSTSSNQEHVDTQKIAILKGYKVNTKIDS